MKKNPLFAPLFYKRCNSNKGKIKHAAKILVLTLLCLFSVTFITTASVYEAKADQPMTFVDYAKCAGMSLCTFPILWVAGKQGEGETDAEFTARKGAAESPESFIARCVKHLNVKIESVETLSKDIPELKTYKETLEGLKTKMASMKEFSSDDATLLKNLKDEVEKVNTTIEGLRERGGVKNTFKAQVYKFIEDNKQQIKDLFSKGSGQIEMKVVGAITTASGSNPDGIPDLQGSQVAPPQNINLKASIVDALVTTIPTSLASYAYTESIPKDGDYSFVAEGGAKPQTDFEWETRYAAPKKVAAYMKLTEESVQDVPNLQAIAYDFLRKKHDLKRQNGILFGDGTGANPTGATVYGRTFSADDLANQVASPNIMDVINAAITDIFTTHNYTDEMPYQANLVMLHPVDFFIHFVSAKDTQGHPLFPSATLFNRVVIGGVSIIPFEDIPAGSIFVADLSKYNITSWMPYTVKIGWVNDDFIKNQFCIVGESRFHAFVKKLDEQAFIYDEIATIKAAIEAP